ncbi:MAG: TRASH domain-containing protein [Thermoanaerobaculia bacterium]|nr:TRASH domain-containing protein [Thermoanaerobaculia bacterium]
MKRLSILRTLTLLGLAGVALCAALATFAEEAPTPAPATAVRKVEAKFVCMVNNSLFAKEQIAVEVEGRTYYGCCEMCKERLAKEAAAREALDPVSGAVVDKATAVIGAQGDGSVLYFENEENLTKYNAMQPAEQSAPGQES